MTAAEMESKLGIRLNHENPERTFSITERYSFLNEGQLYVVQELPIDMVRPVETVSNALAVDANGAINLAALSRLTVVEEGSPSTTLFKGTAGEGLSAVNDAYKGAVIYNITNGTSHVVTGYTGATLQFTVTAEAAAEPRTWDSGDEFIFPNNELTLPIPLNGDRGILDVLHSSGYYCHEITDYDWKRLIEYSLIYNGINPGYRLQGTDVLLRPFTFGTTTGVIHYKAVPAAITDSVNSVLSATVQELIVDYAFYIGLKTGLQFTAAGELLRLVDSQIIDYVNKYTPPRRVIMKAGDGYGYCGRNGQGNIYSR